MSTTTPTTEFTGKVVYITGGGQGIGRATAVAFAQAGASVAVADIDLDAAEETAALLRDAGGTALALRVDVSREEDVTASLARTVETFGTLDIAFNNAGVEQADAPTGEVDVEVFDRIMGTNVRGVFLCMRQEIPLLQANGGGVIVNTTSGAGVIGIKGQAVYSASKHAIIGLTRSVALDYADAGIRVNAIAPGIIDTSMMSRVFGEGEKGREAASSQEPIGRPGRADEIADAVMWLSSAKAAFTIGHTLVMDGGQTIQ